jgi:hypothetical protein
MDTFNARKWRKRSAHGLMPGSGERDQHMDTFIAWKGKKRSAHGYFYCPEVEKEISIWILLMPESGEEVSTWILLLPGSGERSQHMDTFNARKWR